MIKLVINDRNPDYGDTDCNIVWQRYIEKSCKGERFI